MQDPDPRTLGPAQAGALPALEGLVRSYQADVWRFAYHLTRDRALADDVTQEAFIRAFRFLGSYRGDAKFTSWLFRSARECGMGALRARTANSLRDPPLPAPVTDPVSRAELAAAL